MYKQQKHHVPMVYVEDYNRGNGWYWNQDTSEKEIFSDHRNDNRSTRNQFHEQELENAEGQHNGDAHTNLFSAITRQIEGKKSQHVDGYARNDEVDDEVEGFTP